MYTTPPTDPLTTHPNPLLPSDVFNIEGNIFAGSVKSETNVDPSFGPTEYTVTIGYDPKYSSKGKGKARRGKGGKNYHASFMFTCSCASFDGSEGICKHIGAYLTVHFRS